MECSFKDAERQIRQLEARIAHQQMLAAKLSRNGFRGAAADALSRLATLEGHLGRGREIAAAMRAPTPR